MGASQDCWITEGSSSFQHTVLGLTSRGSDRFTRDEGGTLISRRNGAARHYYLFDALGSVTGLTDSAGALSERYDYEPYGTPAPRATGQWAQGSADVATGQFGFAAGYRSVGGLYHYGQRFYDPENLRWTQPDPIDQTGDLRQGNRYGYAAMDPIGQADPSGDILPALAVGAVTAAARVTITAAAPRVATYAASRAVPSIGTRVASTTATRTPAFSANGRGVYLRGAGVERFQRRHKTIEYVGELSPPSVLGG